MYVQTDKGTLWAEFTILNLKHEWDPFMAHLHWSLQQGLENTGGQVYTFEALFLTSWLPGACAFPNGLSVRLSEQTLRQGARCSRCSAASVQPNTAGFAPFHQHHRSRNLSATAFAEKKDSATAHVVVRHCSERMFSNLENECS